jgi:hypothetical protein
MSVERFLKTLHGWLGFVILPWIVMAGVTGLFQNHPNLILGLMPNASIEGELLDSQPPMAVDAAQVAALAQSVMGISVAVSSETRFKSRDVYRVTGPQADLYVDRATGGYWVSGHYTQRLYAADGTRLGLAVKWSKVLSALHKRGWLSDRFGSWPADIAAGALTVFGLSGLYLFIAPRLRKLRNKRARRQAGLVKTA